LARKRFEIEREQRVAGATVLQKQFRGRKVRAGHGFYFIVVSFVKKTTVTQKVCL
jgi:hypothetical protein